MSVALSVPKLTDNDDCLLVTDVLVAEGDRVEEGQPVVVVETSKATTEIAAPAAGWIKSLRCEKGIEYPVGHILLHIVAKSDAEPVAPPEALKPAAEPPPAPSRSPTSVRASARARKLAEAAGIDIESLGRAVVRARDLAPYLAGNDGRAAFLALVRKDDAFRRLSSPLKVMAYRNAGFDVDESAVIEPGAILLAPEIRIGTGVRIGADTVIRADARIEIGAGTHIGASGDLECVHLMTGRDVRIMEKVKMDVAGGGVPEAGVFVGDRALISEGCFINACRPVRLGIRTAMSPRSMIFTHRFWHNVFEGHDAVFAPVTMEDEAWLGAGAQLAPGVVLGRGAQVMSGSMVVHSVAADTLAGGIPAQAIKRGLRRELSPAEKNERLDRLMGLFLDILESRGCHVERHPDGHPRLARVKTPAERRYCLAWPEPPTAAPAKKERLVVVGFDLADDPAVPELDLGRQTMLGPRDRMADELREFFRRRGLDFAPHGWIFDRSRPL